MARATTSRHLIAAATILLAGMAPAATAAPVLVQGRAVDPDPPRELTGAELDRLIANLDADEPAVRENATIALIRAPGLGPDRLIARLADPDLSFEQRRRLRSTAERLFLASEAPGLGVQFSPGEADGVSITRVIDNFPAAETLQAGDTFLELAGQPLESTEQMRIVILSHLPGETMSATISRVGEGLPQVLEVEVPLGRFADLGNNRAPALPDRRRAFLERLARAGVSDGAPGPAVGIGVSPADWLRAEGYWPADALDENGPGLGLAAPKGIRSANDPTQFFAIAGGPTDGTERDTIQRSGDRARERVITQQLASSRFDTELDAALAGVRFTVRRIVELRMQIEQLDARPALPNRARREASIERERQTNDEQLRAFLAVLAAETAAMGLPPEPRQDLGPKPSPSRKPAEQPSPANAPAPPDADPTAPDQP